MSKQGEHMKKLILLSAVMSLFSFGAFAQGCKSLDCGGKGCGWTMEKGYHCLTPVGGTQIKRLSR